MLGLAAFLDLKGGPKIAQGIMWFALGAIVGWPFAGALILPLLAEEAMISVLSGSIGSFSLAILDGAVRCLGIAVSYRYIAHVKLSYRF
jgi:alpha-1,2-mannosyltransferase